MLKKSDKHECNIWFYKQYSEIGHVCYMRPLTGVLPENADKVIYVFYEFEKTKNTMYFDKEKVHVSNLVCGLQCCSSCTDVEDGGDCFR